MIHVRLHLCLNLYTYYQFLRSESEILETFRSSATKWSVTHNMCNIEIKKLKLRRLKTGRSYIMLPATLCISKYMLLMFHLYLKIWSNFKLRYFIMVTCQKTVVGVTVVARKPKFEKPGSRGLQLNNINYTSSNICTWMATIIS